MRNPREVDYLWFVIGADDEIISGWEYLKDAREALEEAKEIDGDSYVRHKRYISPYVLKRFLDRNDLAMRKNPHGMIEFDKNIMQDAIRMSEYRFHKPILRFEKPEFDYLWRLYNKAADQRLSLKIYPDRSNPTRRKRTKEEVACEKRALKEFAKALMECREPVPETWTNPRSSREDMLLTFLFLSVAKRGGFSANKVAEVLRKELDIETQAAAKQAALRAIRHFSEIGLIKTKNLRSGARGRPSLLLFATPAGNEALASLKKRLIKLVRNNPKRKS